MDERPGRTRTGAESSSGRRRRRHRSGTESIADQIDAALRRSVLADPRLVWTTRTVRQRLRSGLVEAARTLALLERRYHLPVFDVVQLLAGVALEWYRSRPLAADADYAVRGTDRASSPCARSKTTADALWGASLPKAARQREALVSLRRAGDLLRDHHQLFASLWDDAEAQDRSRGWSPADSRTMRSLETVLASRQALTPAMSDNEVQQRLADTPDDVYTHAIDADLFCPESIAGLSGIGFMQAAVLVVRFVENRIRGSHGRVGTQPGRAPLAAERVAAQQVVEYFNRECGRQLHPHAAVLVVAACPSTTLREWQREALQRAVLDLGLHERPVDPTPGTLPDSVYAVYAAILGRRLNRLLTGKVRRHRPH
jgi:hypothetical protein